jgi:hypothetical protein
MTSFELPRVLVQSSTVAATEAAESEPLEGEAPEVRLLGHITELEPSKRHQVAVREWGRDSHILKAFRIENDTTIFEVVLIPEGRSRRTAAIRRLALTELKTGNLVLVKFEVKNGRAVTQAVEKLG